MPKPLQFSYEKKSPFRDSTYFIIVCEGKNREPEYFRFFEGISSRVKIVPVPSVDGNSSPDKLINNAVKKEEELEDFDSKIDKVWFVMDTDLWKEKIRELRNECKIRKNWHVAQSNPCFEVWLYFHAKSTLPELLKIDHCNHWKPHIPKVIQGGFNPDFHPIAVELATKNAKASYQSIGDTPEPGSTQVWQLAEALLPLVKSELYKIKDIIPEPIVIGGLIDILEAESSISF